MDYIFEKRHSKYELRHIPWLREGDNVFRSMIIEMITSSTIPTKELKKIFKCGEKDCQDEDFRVFTVKLRIPKK